MENMVIDDKLLFFGSLFKSLSAIQFLLSVSEGFPTSRKDEGNPKWLLDPDLEFWIRVKPD